MQVRMNTSDSSPFLKVYTDLVQLYSGRSHLTSSPHSWPAVSMTASTYLTALSPPLQVNLLLAEVSSIGIPLGLPLNLVNFEEAGSERADP